MMVAEGEVCPTCGVVYKGLYQVWHMIRQRCNNPNARNYHNYGGRGIKICPEWDNSYKAFAEYLGPRPSRGHSVDRIDNDGNYEPGNVRWATREEQNNNKRNSGMVTWEGVSKTPAQWARVLGISSQSMRYRLEHWPIEDVFTRSPQDGTRKRYDARM